MTKSLTVTFQKPSMTKKHFADQLPVVDVRAEEGTYTSSTDSINVVTVDTLSEMLDKVVLLDVDQTLKLLSLFIVPSLVLKYQAIT